ncbi:MAG: membrane dipeptidase [Clostridia bacterium]|nr:membrane dipeptidase [Clostridia bacterium]
MFIADTHCDTLFALGVEHKALNEVMASPERLAQGGVCLQTTALWTGPKGNAGDVAGIVAAEMSQVPVLEAAGLRRVDDPAEAKQGGLCFMLSVEGGEVFEGGLETVSAWREKGVRMAALTWNHENAIGYPAKGGGSRGLKPYGIEAVREMQRVGIAVDTSHLNEAGFFDIFARTDKPPMASHSCCKALCSHARNLTDEQLRLLIREGGYVGVNFYPFFLSDDGKADADTVAEHIDRICQMGGAGIVGFGSDFDGIETTPADLRDASELDNLLNALRRRGYSEEAIAGIAGQNLLDYFARIS